MASVPDSDTPPIPANERLIVALDVPTADAARALVETLGDTVGFYKIGLELASTSGYFELLDWLLARDKRVFADLKLYDIPATVGAAVRQIARSGASFLTVHGDRAIMQAAADNKGGSLQVLAVTVLTSIDRDDLTAMGITMDVRDLAVARATQAIATGCDGIIASGLEAAHLREVLGAGPLIVTPGIRPPDDRGRDDQKRVVTATDALSAGADYLVVGRPIRAAADPRAAAESLQQEISAALR